MAEAPAGPIHAFLTGGGRDGRGRSLADVLAFDDARIEGVHDVIQWLFPLSEPSRAVPGAPVLGASEAAAIRADPAAQAGLLAARDRMLRFYAGTDGWLTALDHNHLRITRILTALRDLAGRDEAEAFHAAILRLNETAGSPVNPESLDYWRRAVEA
ncbi:Opioid growth factor receptor (OGFr) conserved region [Methylobacterium tarhaniae]|uniref:Opioid growth factor receptor (OGFr) conserved region n=1 Tax=Methylobacterium tarhaniae TaxID=1187852 RepID=A0A0J6T9G1_9HYPH|nr:opioid growth factor receptor-related protein [Methylobacterium tarhaniae]KMO42504.1 Opioid growth factor receptor (OGFr) conserved region [Methylobacterium tarhaniae]